MFKSSFKYYKSKNPPPNLGDVLDLENSEELLKKSKVCNESTVFYILLFILFIDKTSQLGQLYNK